MPLVFILSNFLVLFCLCKNLCCCARAFVKIVKENLFETTFIVALQPIFFLFLSLSNPGKCYFCCPFLPYAVHKYASCVVFFVVVVIRLLLLFCWFFSIVGDRIFSLCSIFAFVLHVKQNAFRLLCLLWQLFRYVVIYLFRSSFCWIMNVIELKIKKMCCKSSDSVGFRFQYGLDWNVVVVVVVVGTMITGCAHCQNGKL